ncbi:MAG: response regulator transcription factor [Lachnospiraceae bacterium]|nr:response regulator transcription factor [Lachnospiraceae bacterium]
MLNIGICDDCVDDMNLIYELVTKTLFAEDDMKIFRYQSGKELIRSIENKVFNCNLLYLDICMPEVDGLDVASYIRENRVDVDIIFVTKTPEFVYKGYMYKAFSYILKPGVEEDLPEETMRYIDEIRNSEECINVTSDGIQRKVPISQIMYVESSKRKIILHLKAEDIPFYAKMSEIEPVLAERGFVRTHQSYMVKAKCVTRVSSMEVLLGDTSVPVSRRYSQQIAEMFA